MLGQWNERSVGLIPEGDIIVSGKPHRAYSIMIGKRGFGSMRRVFTHGWTVNIVGFHFNTIEGQGAARFGLKQTTVKLFKTAPEARAAIKEAYGMINRKVVFA